MAVHSSKALWTVGLPRRRVVVVHGRQIVVDERIAVHALERRRGCERGLRRNAEQGGALQSQEGTQPLAAGERPQPHRLDQPGRGAVGGCCVEDCRKARFDKRRSAR